MTLFSAQVLRFVVPFLVVFFSMACMPWRAAATHSGRRDQRAGRKAKGNKEVEEYRSRRKKIVLAATAAVELFFLFFFFCRRRLVPDHHLFVLAIRGSMFIIPPPGFRPGREGQTRRRVPDLWPSLISFFHSNLARMRGSGRIYRIYTYLYGQCMSVCSAPGWCRGLLKGQRSRVRRDNHFVTGQ